ncbi:hypothetical protein ACFO9E_18160 [Streptomyces maoxianensis]|uniref:Major tail protein n=1 Tax=Streptomyces maoxianensis TaxID=1459942 RepID=A0ABV9G647_9ACTN
MTKTTGLGDELLVGGYQLSGDIQQVGNISSPMATLDMTGINKPAYERVIGLRDGAIEMTTFFNPASGQAHPVLSSLPTADVQVMYLRGTTLGNPSACLVSKQINYDGSRAADGSFTFGVSAQANGFGLEWGQQLTAGLRTDTAATNGTSIDTAASASFGAQAYLQVTSFTGTDCTITIEDSANNSTFAPVTGMAFSEINLGPTTERISIANTATVRRYVRVATSTTGGFSSISFVVVINKNAVAGVKF